MFLKYEALESHLAKELASLYVLTGDEHLLLLEAADMIRKTAREKHFSEREVLTVERNFKWGQLHATSNAMSLFGDKKLIELRIPGGRPGKEGSLVLQEYANKLNPDSVTLITLPKLDWTTRKSAWASALQKSGVYIEIPTIELSRLGDWIATRLGKQNQTASKQCIDFLVDRVDQVCNSVLNVARYDLFKLNEAMLSGNRARFIRMMEGLKGEGEPLPLVLWTFTEEIRILLKCRLALENGQTFASMAKALRLRGQREKLIQDAVKRLEKKELQIAMQQTAQIDKIVKGLRPDAWMDDAWDALMQLGLSIART